mgnify:CR=1 FL=1
MKTIILSLGFLFLAVVSNAAISFNLSAQGNTLVLNPRVIEKSEMTVKIIDHEGQIVYAHTYTAVEANSLKKYNLSRLNDGIYQIIIADAASSAKQTIAKDLSGIKVYTDVATFVKPSVRLDGRHLKVNYINMDRTATLRILDPNFTTIYETKVSDPIFAKAFDLTKLIPGEYTITLTNENGPYTESFILK